MEVVNLGLIKAIHVSTTPPTNKALLWFDDNPGQKKHKFYNQITATWITLNPSLQYMAYISQVGTNAPTAVEKFNTIGPVTWARGAVGAYAGTFNSGILSPTNSFITFSQSRATMAGAYNIVMNCNNANILMILTQYFAYNGIGSGLSDNVLNYTWVKIDTF